MGTREQKMRPEHTAPPEIFYNVDEAQKYSRNTRVMEIQATMSERAIEMLNLNRTSPLLCWTWDVAVDCRASVWMSRATHGSAWTFPRPCSTSLLSVKSRAMCVSPTWARAF